MALQNRVAILTQQLQVRRTLTLGMYEVEKNDHNHNIRKTWLDSNIFCDFFIAGLGEKAQTGGGYIPLPFTGSCTGQLD